MAKGSTLIFMMAYVIMLLNIQFWSWYGVLVCLPILVIVLLLTEDTFPQPEEIFFHLMDASDNDAILLEMKYQDKDSQYIIFISTSSCGKESLSEKLRMHFQKEQYFLHSVVCMSSSVTLLNTLNSIFNCGEQPIKFAELFQVAILDEIQEQTHEVIKKWKRNRIKVTYNSALNLKVECLSLMTKENIKTMFSLIKYKDNNKDIMCITTPISYKSLKFFNDGNVQFRVQTTKTFNSKIRIEDVLIKINPVTPPILHCKISYPENQMTALGTMLLSENKHVDSVIIGRLSSDLNLTSIVGTISHQELVKPTSSHSMFFGKALEVSMAFNITKQCLLMEGEISNLGLGSLFYQVEGENKAGYALSVQLKDSFQFQHLSENLSRIDKLIDIKCAHLLAFSLPNNSFDHIEEMLTNLFSSALEAHKFHSVSEDKQIVSLKAFSSTKAPEYMTIDVSKECSGLLFIGKVLLKTESGLLKRLSDVSQSSDTIDVGMWVSNGEKTTTIEICGKVSELSLSSFTVEKATFNYSQKESDTSLNLYFSVSFEEIGVTAEGTMSLCEDKDQDSIIIGKLSSDLNLSSIVGTISHQELVKPTPEHSMSFGAALEVSMAFNITKECLLVEGKISNLGLGNLFYERGDKSKAGYALSIQLEENFLFEHLSNNLSEIDKLLDIKYARLLVFSLPNTSFHQIEEILTNLFSSAIETHKSHSVSKDRQVVSLRAFSGLTMPKHMTTDVSKECSGLLFIGEVLLKTESGLLKRLSDVSQSSDTIDVGMWVSNDERETTLEICGEVSELSIGSFTVEKAIFNYSKKESGTSLNLYFSVTFEEIGVTAEGTMSLYEDKDQDSIIIGKLSTDLNLSSIVGTISHQELVKPTPEHSMSFGTALEVSMAFNITKECLLVEGKTSNLGSGSLFYERGDKSKGGYALSVQLEESFLFEHLSDNLSEIDKVLDIKYARLLVFSLPNNSFCQIEETLTNLFSSAIETHKSHFVSKDKQLVSLKAFSGLKVPENMTTDVSKECSGLLFIGKVLLKTESGLLKRLSDISQSSDTIDVCMWVSSGEKETTIEICGEVSHLSLGSFTVEKAAFNYSQKELGTYLNLYFSVTFEEIGVTGEGTMSLCEDKDQDSIMIGKLSTDLNLSSIVGTISHQELVKLTPQHSMSFGAALEVSMAFNITKECLLVEGKISNLGLGNLFYERGDKSKAGYAISIQLEENFLFEHLSNNLSEIDKLLDIKYAHLLAFSLPNTSFNQIEEILTNLFSSAIETHKSHSVSKDRQVVSLRAFLGLTMPKHMTTDVSKECSGLLFIGEVLLKTESGLLKRLSDVSQSSDTIDVGMWVSSGEKEITMEICGEVLDLSLGSITVEKAIFNYSQKESDVTLNLYFSVSFEEIGVTAEGTMLLSDSECDSFFNGHITSHVNLTTVTDALIDKDAFNLFDKGGFSFESASVLMNTTKSTVFVEGCVTNLGSGGLFIDLNRKGFALSMSLDKGFQFSSLSDTLTQVDNFLKIKSAEMLMYCLQNSSAKGVIKQISNSFPDLSNLPSLNTFADAKVSLPSDSFGFILFCHIDIMKGSPLSKLQKITGTPLIDIKFGITVSKEKNKKTPKLELYGDVADFSLAEDIHINKAVAQYIWGKDYQSLYLSCSVSFNSFEIKGAMYISEESVIIGTLKSNLPLSSAAKFGQKSNTEFTDLAPTNIRTLSLTSAKVAFNMSKPCMLIDGSIEGLGSVNMFIERGINKDPNFVLSVQVKNFKFSSLSDAGMFSEIDNLIQIKSAELLVYSLPESSLKTLNNKITDIFQATLESHKDNTSLPSLNLYSSSHLDLLEKSSIEGSGVILMGALSFSEKSFFYGLKEITDTSSLNEIQIGVCISKGNLKNARPKLIFCGHLSEWLLTENDEIKVSNLMFRYTWEKGKQHLLAKGKVSIAVGNGRLCVDAELNIQNDAATLTAKGFESDSIHGLKKIKGTVRNLKVEGILKKKKKPEVKITGLLDLKANICFNCLLHFEATKLTLLKITLSEEISVCSLLKAVNIESEDLESLDLVLKKGGTLYFASKSFTDSGENYKEGYDLNLTASIFFLDKEFSVHAHFSKKRKLEWMKGYACEKIKVAFVKFTDLEFQNGPAIVHEKGCTRFEVGIELFGWQFLQGTLSMIKKKERGRRGRTYFEGSPKLCLVNFFQPSITVRWRKKDFRIVKLELGLDPFELFGEFLGCIKKYAILLYRLVKSLKPTPTVKVRFSTDENPDPDRYLMICNFTIVLGVMFLGFEIEALEIPIRIRIPTGFLADSWSQFLFKIAKENYAVIFETLWNVVRYELIKIPGNIIKSAVRGVVDAGKAVIEDAKMMAREVVKAGKAIGSFFRCIFNCIKVESDHGIAASIIGGKLYFDKESGKWECEPIEHSNKVPPFTELFGPYAAVIGIGQFIKDMCSACDGNDVTPEVDQMMRDLVHIDEISNLAQQEVSELLTVRELDMKLDSNNNISLSWKMDDEVTEKEEGKVDYIVTIIATVVSKGKITENELQLKYIRRRASKDPLIIKDNNFSKVVSRAISIKVSIKACVRMTVQPEFNKDIIPTDEQQMSRFRLRTGTELVRTEITLLGKILHCEFFKEINHCQDLHPPVILHPYNNCLEKCISGEIETVENAAEYLVEIVDTTKRVLNRQLLSHSHNDNIGFSLKLPDSLADFQSPYQIRALSISSEGTSSEHHECMQLFNQQHLPKLSCLLNENLEAKLTLPFKSIDNFKSGLSVILKCTPEGKTPVYLMEHSLDLTSYQLCADGEEVVFYHKFSLEQVRKKFVRELICLESMVIAKGDENTLDSDPLLSNEINLLPTLKALNVFYSLEVGTLIVIWTQVAHSQAYKIEFSNKANQVPILTKIITVDDKDVLALLEDCCPPHSIVKCTDYLPSVYFLSENDMKSLNKREYVVQITAMGPNCISSPSRETKIEFLATEMNYQKEDNTIQVIFEEREDYQYQVELVDVSDPALPISVYSHHFSMDKNRMKLQLNLASIKSKLHSASSFNVFIKCTNKNIVEYANLTPDKCQEKIWEHQVALEVETGEIQIFDFKALSQQALCGYSSSEISVQQLSEELEILSVEIIKKSTKEDKMTCDGVCTYSLTKTKHVKQPFYRCVDCSTESCCVSCIRNCHISHNILYCGIFNDFCDCGLKECESNCKISHKCSFDEHDEHSNMSKMRGFECYTCRGEESEFSCCETCANECHLGHSLVPLDSTDFICDCGENSHKTKQCTYDQYGNTLKLQEWYSCQTCCPNTSDFGCCKLCAKECHSGHELVLNEAKEFSCDCGLNNHSASHLSAMATSGTACTYGSVKTNIIKQHIYKCHTCKNTHCCTPCIEKCHIGHNVEYSGISSAFCDCGLQYCAIPCKFGSKCTYDQYGSASMNQKWYECLSCWDEESGYGCCVVCAEECHSGHNLVSHTSKDFVCTCGDNRHKVALKKNNEKSFTVDNVVCTYTTTKKESIDQPFYRCYTCFTGSNKGCCSACVEHCHKGHNIKDSGIKNAFCDCGLLCCDIPCKIGSKCTYDQYVRSAKNQKWYECLSCWDINEESGYGCCVVCAEECHSGHNLVSHESGDFFCDCGANNHIVTPKKSVCTYTITKKEYVKQPFFRCHTCFTESNNGCCSACVEKCHRGHNMEYGGITHAFCDCGLECCDLPCRIGSKCTYDQYGSNARNQKWYECLSCWDEESGYRCCVVCAEECHLGHNLVSHKSGDFSCDCGANSHKVIPMYNVDAICTYTTTKIECVDQLFYRCHTCFTESNKGCCRACVENCHRGHNIKESGIIKTFCDCGLEYCAIHCKIGSKCTYDQYGSVFINQKWYECLSCWDEGSGYGCCVVCAEECHSGHNLVSHESGDFFCDCGASSHKVTPNYRIDAICTYTTTKKKYVDQPLYQCHTCFTESNKGCCRACVENCHRGHDIEDSGIRNAFCDCGLECCDISCKIGPKCTYDQYGSAARNQKWYECLSCWGKESRIGCCEVCANECHSGHELVAHHDAEDFICHCGISSHQTKVCTNYFTGNQYLRQPFYFCHSCFTNPRAGCCYQCMQTCHLGHHISFKGSVDAFCDCGKFDCKITCAIGTP